LEPLFDKQKDASPSIGALAVSESDPNIIYVGTGEACIRGNIVGGNGVYKSIDAGKTWKFIGLGDTHAIGRLIVNPKNPDIAFVAALGHPFGDNEERGVFRTRDGGKTWEKVLHKDAKTGAIDITFDPSNSNILFAALWQARRTPWSMDSGGPGAACTAPPMAVRPGKRSKRTDCPKRFWGRIGVTVSGANPNRVWRSWKRRRAAFTAPMTAARTGSFSPTITASASAPGTTRTSSPIPSPLTPSTFLTPACTVRTMAARLSILCACARRQSRPVDRSHKPEAPHQLQRRRRHYLYRWRAELDQRLQPADRAVYHVTTDNRFPYYIYGAQQDNSTVGIASASADGAIDRPNWYDVGGGESGILHLTPQILKSCTQALMAEKSRATITALEKLNPSTLGQ